MSREIEFHTWNDEEKEQKRQAMMDVASQGGFAPAQTLALGLASKDTYYRWKREIPEFAEWCAEAKLRNQACLERLLVEQASGRCKGSAKSLELALRNAHGDDYKAPTESSGSVSNNTTNNYLILSKDEVKEKIAQQMEQLKIFGEQLPQIDLKPDYIDAEQ